MDIDSSSFQIRIPDPQSQQHDCLKARSLGLAGRGRGRQARPRRIRRRLAARREKTEADLNCGAGEAVLRGVLCRSAAAQRRKDRSHCRQVGPQEERGPRLVLQPEAEAEEDEVCGAGGSLRKRRSLGEFRAAAAAGHAAAGHGAASRGVRRRRLRRHARRTRRGRRGRSRPGQARML